MRTVLMIAMLVGAAATASAQERLADQLRKGIVQEEASQNLDMAIQAYESIVAQFDEARKTAGTALFRLAECYRKAGKREQAMAAYQRVVREFSDQAAMVESSRQHLAAFGVSDSRPAMARPATGPAVARRQMEVSRKVSPERQVKVAREVPPEPARASMQRPMGSLEATKIEIDLMSKRLADLQKKVDIGLASRTDYEELQAQQLILVQRYQEQARERDANERAAQESRLLNQQMIKSVEAEIQLIQQRIAAIERNISANVGPPQQETEMFQLRRDLLGLQRRLDELRAELKR
jgi:tetratricopeptide (TPR) repeat protein